MRTVLQFKRFVFAETGVREAGKFCQISDSHEAFFIRLNNLGWKKKTKRPEETKNVDATAPLTDDEWAELEAEFRRLQ